MKAALFILIFSIAFSARASTNDIIAIKAAVPTATEIRSSASGYTIITSSGARTAYKTPTGYYIEGGKGSANQQIIRTSTGYRIEDSGTRGDAFSNHSSKIR